MTLMLFVVLWLTSYRVTRLILDDTLFKRQRDWLYLRFPPSAYFAALHPGKTASGRKYFAPDQTKANRPVRKLGELFYCYWCIGFWVAGAVVLVAELFVSIPLPGMTWCALSTAVGLTARNLDRG